MSDPIYDEQWRKRQTVQLSHHFTQAINGVGDYHNAVVALSAEIDRLNDLRRWRPLREHPVDDRWVMVREAEDSPFDLETGSTILVGRIAGDGFWEVFEDGRRVEPAGCEWTYIPGSEPEVPRG